MTKSNPTTNILKIVSEVTTLPNNAKILDLGCGNGDFVQEYCNQKYSAYGCDFQFKEGNNVEYLNNKKLIRIIENPYRLPFEDELFDLVVSYNVLEHVTNYEETFAEIHRVLKPSGVSLHIFSSRYRLLEAHRLVPFGAIIKSYWWLAFWAYLGVRNNNQKKIKMTRMEILKNNYHYLNNHTNYLSKSQMKSAVSQFFPQPLFYEKYFLKNSKRGVYLYYLSKLFPFIPSLYSCLRTRVLFVKKRPSFQ